MKSITVNDITISIDTMSDTCKGTAFEVTNFNVITNNTKLRITDICDIGQAVERYLGLTGFGCSIYVTHCFMDAIQSGINERTETIKPLDGEIEYWAVKLDTVPHHKYADYRLSVKRWDTI